MPRLGQFNSGKKVSVPIGGGWVRIRGWTEWVLAKRKSFTPTTGIEFRTVQPVWSCSPSALKESKGIANKFQNSIKLTEYITLRLDGTNEVEQWYIRHNYLYCLIT